MRITVFFVCLFFLLMRGDAAIYAGAYHHSEGSIFNQHIAKNHLARLTSINPVHPVITDCEVDAKIDYLVSDDSEDEDSNNFAAAKDRLPARSHLVTYTYPSYTAILNYRCNCFKAPPFFFRQVSDKCILLSTFRI